MAGNFLAEDIAFSGFWAALMWTAGFSLRISLPLMGSRGEDTRGLKGQDSKAYVSDSGFATGKRHIQALAAFWAGAAFRISTAIHDDLSGRRHALRKQVAHAPFALSLAELHSIYMENGACGLHQSRSKRAYAEGACPWQEHLATRRASNRKNYADSAFSCRLYPVIGSTRSQTAL